MAPDQKPSCYIRAQLDVDEDREIVRYMREMPPSHYSIKIESFSKLLENLKQTKRDMYESGEFSAGGYKWLLCIYPQGNKKENGEEYISMYLRMVDKLEPQVVVNISLKFFIFDHIRLKYLTILDIKEKRFHSVIPEWGISKVLSQKEFTEASNGFLFHNCCVLGVEALVISKSTVENGGIINSMSVVKESDLEFELNTYTWKINEFSDRKTETLITSPVFTIKGHSWKLLLYPKGRPCQRGNTVSIFLSPSDISKVTGTERLATKFEICLKNQLQGKDEKSSTAVGFCKKTKNWGYAEFVSPKEFNDPSSGFKVNDSVIIKVTIEDVMLLKS